MIVYVIVALLSLIMPVPLDYTQSVAVTQPIFAPYHFAKKTICIESAIPKAPFSKVATMFNAAGFRTVVRWSNGGCARSGYTAAQRVNFSPFTAADLRLRPNSCGFAMVWNAGNKVTQAYVRINMSSTAPAWFIKHCRVDHWTGVWAHELAHPAGLAHRPAYEVSIMGGEDYLTPLDRIRLTHMYKYHSF